MSLHTLFKSLIVVALLLLGACADWLTGLGRLKVSVQDAPVDRATQVVVQFRGIELNGPTDATYYFCQGGGTSTSPCASPAPKVVDLLQLRTSAQELLSVSGLRTGGYQWLRLLVDAQSGARDSYIVIDGNEYELEIPSGAESGLKINRGFEVTSGDETALIVDFDLRKSVHAPQNPSTSYVLRPTLRSVDANNVGIVEGAVDSARIVSGCVGAVYAYGPGDAFAAVIPDDIDGDSGDPLTSAPVTLDASTGQYRYRIALLEPGGYQIAFTCDAGRDDAGTDDSVTYPATAIVRVSANATTTHNF